MRPEIVVTVIIASIFFVGILLYWQLVVAEGVYLGQAIVTFLYDVTARRYDSIKQFDSRIEATYLGEPLAKAIRQSPAATILDIGTGTGRLARAILEQAVFQGRIIGLDTSMPMLIEAAKSVQKFQPRVSLLCKDASKLPFESDCFEVITCLEMLEFTQSPTGLIQEVFRVLNSGGLFLTTRRRGIDAWLMPGKTHSPNQFQAVLASTGFENIVGQAWQIDYDLYWARKPGTSNATARNILELLCCPRCGVRKFRTVYSGLICQNCNKLVKIVDNVIDLR